jgi:predicted ATPase/predicted Ser/Thr protein kinase
MTHTGAGRTTCSKPSGPDAAQTIVSSGIPVSIGPFRVVRELGRGGMGVVFLAQDSRLDRLVAIKAIIPEVAKDAARLAMFRDEARLIAQMNHPHIAQIHQLVEDNGQLYLVMEYVTGQSLREAIREGISFGDSIGLMAQIADALEAAHRKRIVHRDLKPENVRLTDDGAVKVLDFGIAQTLAAPSFPAPEKVAASTHLSLKGAVAGTPGYMAPEQCRGERVDARADVFAFGCLMYECFCGQPAYSGASAAELIEATLTTDPDLGRLPRSLPQDLIDLLRLCLVRNREHRRPNLAGVARLLRGKSVEQGEGASPIAPNNLPRELDAFIGRTAEIAELARLVQEHPLVTLTGAGGCGKTRLAMELGRRLLDRFDGGVWFVDLGAVGDGAQVPGAVAGALGLKDVPDTPIAAAIARKCGHARSLLLLDNCEHVLAVAGSLVSSLLAACPTLRIVATSREALALSGEHSWRVPGLAFPAFESPLSIGATEGLGAIPRPDPGHAAASTTPPEDLRAYESVALFIDRANAVRPAFEPKAAGLQCIARICQRLDGLPLAIELAAARVKALTPEEVERRLDQRFKVLRAGHARSERHQTLRATVDWSYRLLSPSEKRTLRWLSVFAGGCTLEAACRVLRGADADEFETLDLLTQLIDKSLLISDDRGGSTRFRLLETIRQYGLEELDRENETTSALIAHLDYYASLAADWARRIEGPELPVGLRLLAAEHDNFAAALAGARVVQNPAAALRVCAGLQRDWMARGCFTFAREACRAALSIPGSDEHPAERAGALLTASLVEWRLNNFVQAKADAAEALSLARSVANGGDRSIEGRAEYRLAIIAAAESDADATERHATNACRLAEKSGDELNLAMAHNSLGMSRCLRGDLDGARAAFDHVVALGKRLEHPQVQSMGSNNAGFVAHQQGDLSHACAYYLQGLELSWQGGDRIGLAFFLERAGMLASTLADHRWAARLFGAAERARADMGIPRQTSSFADSGPFVRTSRIALGDTDYEDAAAGGAAMSTSDAVTALRTWLKKQNADRPMG